MDELMEAHRFMMKRYQNIIEKQNFDDKIFLLNFCEKSLEIKNPDKLSRWVGFIQGTLIERDVINVTFERDLSRQIYKPIYEFLGYDTTTVEVEKLNG